MSNKDYYSARPSPDELRLRHLTVDEALPRVHQFLHDTYMAGFRQVRIIHGKGTGMLRETIRRELKKHPLVKSFRAGAYDGGGEGVTVVEFTEK
ncbi:MAG: Smr/MutS family protein [Dehalococcoidales bacterium]